MRQEPIKAYGHLYPANQAMYEAVLTVLRSWNIPDESVELQGDLLRISYEGVFFPAEDMTDALLTLLTPDSRGKLDVFDLEEWFMTRRVFTGQNVVTSQTGLNQVLAYSGL